LKSALQKIDRVNLEDPRHEEVGGIAFPQELVYAKRVTDWALRMTPQASAALLVAARGQHIARWTIPRSNYPMDRGGYLRWREALKLFHARYVGEILQDVGYDADFIARVKALIQKQVKNDPEAQALEDALCLVFLETQFADLKKKTPDDKMKDIIKKTWRKMSVEAQAKSLALNMPDALRAFLQESLRP